MFSFFGLLRLLYFGVFVNDFVFFIRLCVFQGMVYYRFFGFGVMLDIQQVFKLYLFKKSKRMVKVMGLYGQIYMDSVGYWDGRVL